MLTYYTESEHIDGTVVRMFMIDIRGEDIGIVQGLLQMVKAKAKDAIQNGDYKAASRLTDTAEAIENALKDAEEKAKG